ncbi:acetyl-CoA synthetase-like protein [Aaosphaeria arxii CBS 175.79]|uniref:Acetyl-CoA synthetase-like protein n=1 Tax=Aaosphaeria arxii CBS 175.79 TaxID=1450172 RepID=A0A6A5XRN9_9PLEO|nr:acetyl-CoA synthetase-like protein [Aaosphaeria arxii CBS 175.79]KAF2015411.1 acetyl-CoA synthetase-like protein [Aaosphaeria arxii CBS 175.79]
MQLFTDDMCLLSGPSSGVAEKHTAVGPPHTAPPRSVFPLTRSQEGMWLEFATDPTSTKYNLTLEWDVGQKQDGEAVPTTTAVFDVIHTLTKRHPNLRSTFVEVDNKPHIQEFDAGATVPDIRILYRPDATLTEPLVTPTLRRPFDLRNEFSVRWIILKAGGSLRIYLVSHHIMVDGQSMSMISREFMDLLQDPAVQLPQLAPFSSMHMIEKAWARSPLYTANREVLLSQVINKDNGPWPHLSRHHTLTSSDTDPYRKIESWTTFTKEDLGQWSQIFKTSWFRVATTLVGLLVLDQTRPQRNKDLVLSVGFGSRPKEMNSCIGQFANALPVKVPLWKILESKSAGRNFASLVSATGKNISAVKKAEMFPAVDVVRACRSATVDYEPPRVAVTYSPKLAKPECRLFPVEGTWDLFFCFLEYENDVKLGVIYNPKVFSLQQIRDMETKFEGLVQLSKTEKIQLDDMLDWLPSYPALPTENSTASPSVSNNPLKHVHQLIDAHSLTNPNSIALHSSELGMSMTYSELYSSTEKKARVLNSKGIGRESRVVLQLRRGFALMEWILAILKSGAAYIYLDPDLSDVQQSKILDVCKSQLVIDQDTAYELLRTSLDTEDDLRGIELEEVKYGTQDSDLAYMIFTSGSTGEPKGVMVEHGNIAAFSRAALDGTYECGFGTRVLQFASFSFDASILEWTSALCSGATLCFAQHPKQLLGDYLADVLEQNKVSFLQITPTALETLPYSREVSHLRQISVGGEAPSREIFAKWHSRVNLVNSYGPTEAAIAVTFNKIDKTDPLPELISVGRPSIPETMVHICSEDFTSTLLPNSQGEVCIAGPQVARGYCEKPEITAKHFAVHANGQRMYRTGDRGQLLDDGSLLITGRIDRDFKVRGYRISPEEIEIAIMDANCGVRECSVQLSATGLEILACVAPAYAQPKALMSALRNQLALHKVPSRIIAVSTLPKSSSGKIDHKAVRAQGLFDKPSSRLRGSRSETSEASEEDEDEGLGSLTYDAAKKTIANIWMDVLGLPEPPPDTAKFFDLGGHSLLVGKLHAQLKTAFPSKPIRQIDLFNQSTIRQQVALVGGEKSTPRKLKLSTTSRKRSSRKTSNTSRRRRNDSDDRVATTTPTIDTENMIAQIWKNVLQLSEAPSSDTKFFDLGGHSLLIPRIHEEFKRSFPETHVRIVDLFQLATIKQQASLFAGARNLSTQDPIQRVERHRDTQYVDSSEDSSSRTQSDVESGSITPATSHTSSSIYTQDSEVAIIGVGGRFPRARNTDEFYENLLARQSGVSTSETTRETLPGNTWIPKAGTLQDIEDFDHEFWKIPREEAIEMDPQQRILLEVAYEALYDAGISIESIGNERHIGLFVGAAANSYHLQTESVTSDSFLRENKGLFGASLSARTAYHLNLSGPNVTVQTNCASSIVALSLACDAIRQGRCDTAVVAGVSVQLFDGGYVAKEGHMFSMKGECNPFDARADGTVPADAVAAVVLQRHDKAVEDNNPIYANVLGTGIGSDGAIEKAGYQISSPRGQAEVIKSAWRAAGLKPERLRYAEAHGSGTPIGDSLELEGLCLAIREAGGIRAPFTVGSTKGSIGNSQHASGLVSLIKLCKSMQGGVVPPTGGFQSPNEMIDSSLPIEFASGEVKLSRDDVLSVSASGWGGVNSYAILGHPEEGVRKRRTRNVPEGTFERRTLRAPRLGREIVEVGQQAV